jgi:hypothetical protein
MSRVPKRMLQLKEVRLNFLNDLAIGKIAYVDLTPALGANDYYLFDGHLKESGQAIAAQLIYGQLKNELSAGARSQVSDTVHK